MDQSSLSCNCSCYKSLSINMLGNFALVFKLMLVGPVTFLPTFVRYSENAVFEFEFGSGGD